MSPEATARSGALLDARGYRRPAHTLPGARRGVAPRNKGCRYEPEPPTPSEVMRLLQACPTTPKGLRQRALMVVLWRTGIRISEALDLIESDLDAETKTILIRHGKGDKRRTVGLDDWGWIELQTWMRHREQYPVGAVFCVLAGPTAGRRAVAATDVRKILRGLVTATGIRKHITPHSFRHAFAVETIDEDGIGLNDLSRVLGHSSLMVTSIYLRSITDEQIAKKFARRSPPLVPIAHA